MPLKPIYERSPLTALTAAMLRPGQALITNEKIAALCEMLTGAKDQPACWEGAIRLGAIAGCAEVPAKASTTACLESQAEDGGLPLSVTDSVAAMRAALALYEQTAERPILERLARFCGWLSANWEQVIADAGVRTRPGDLMELVSAVYRITGKKAVLSLCEKLRRQGMDWSGVLHTFSVQRPMSRVTPWADMAAGMEAEQGNEVGLYTRQFVTCRAENLADGARASLLNGLYSGNGMELTAARAGWEKLSRHHGAVCGGITADDLIAGASPAAGISAASLGAWAEAFAAQGVFEDQAWAFDALDTLLENGLPAAIQGGTLVPYQRVNGLEKDCGVKDCYHAAESQDVWHALARLARGYAAAVSAAVMTRPDGLQMNLYLPGTYVLPVDGKACRVRVTGADGQYQVSIQTKAPVHAKVRLRVPAWTDDACIRVNDEGADAGKPGEYLTLERTWTPGDTIHVQLGMALRVASGYHQSVAVLYGAKVMAAAAGSAAWAYAVTAAPEVHDGSVTIRVKHTPDWRKKGAVPADMPVLPATEGEEITLTLTPYAETPCRIALFPKGRQA